MIEHVSAMDILSTKATYKNMNANPQISKSIAGFKNLANENFSTSTSPRSFSSSSTMY